MNISKPAKYLGIALNIGILMIIADFILAALKAFAIVDLTWQQIIIPSICYIAIWLICFVWVILRQAAKELRNQHHDSNN